MSSAAKRSDEVIRDLTRLQRPSPPVVNTRGGLAFVVSEGAPVNPHAAVSELWTAPPGEQAGPVAVDAAPSAGTLAWSPDAGSLIYASDAKDGRSSVRMFDGSATTSELVSVEGSVVEITWSADGRELLVLVFDGGGNTAGPAWGAPRHREEFGPQLMTATGGLRRLVRVGIQTGRRQQVEIPATVWEYGWTGGERAVVLVSAGTGENDWYSAHLAELDLSSGRLTTLYESDVQLTAVAMSPDRTRAAFVEGKASDRGLVAGNARVIVVDRRSVSPPSTTQDITSIDWVEADTLYYARWNDLGSAVGRINISTGAETDLWTGPVSLGINFRPSLCVGGGHAASVIQAFHEPPEVGTIALDNPAQGWRKRTGLNDGLAGEPHFSVNEVAWESTDGLEIHGLLLEPEVTVQNAIVAVGHGGPTIAWTHAFEPSHGQATVLAAAGFPVLLPNPRGSTGRGGDFVRMNLGDLGGLDYEDITTGVNWCRKELFGTDDVPAGFVGVSYAGFLACWAAARADCFSSVVAVSTISDWTSFLYESVNGGFAWGHLGPDDRQRPTAPPSIFWDRSPIAHVDERSAPTLIVHGELDYCTPVGQGFEFFHALRWAGVDTEFALYPNEGHWPLARANQVDIHRRTRRWLAQHLLEPSAAELFVDG